MPVGFFVVLHQSDCLAGSPFDQSGLRVDDARIASRLRFRYPTAKRPNSQMPKASQARSSQSNVRDRKNTWENSSSDTRSMSSMLHVSIGTPKNRKVRPRASKFARKDRMPKRRTCPSLSPAGIMLAPRKSHCPRPVSAKNTKANRNSTNVIKATFARRIFIMPNMTNLNPALEFKETTGFFVAGALAISPPFSFQLADSCFPDRIRT